MAEAKVKNEVHENAIWIERVEKETFHAKPTTVCNPNPRQKYFDGAEKLNSRHVTRDVDDSFFERTKNAHVKDFQILKL